MPGVRLATAPRLIVAYLEARGSYSNIGGTMRKLKAWIDLKGIEQAGLLKLPEEAIDTVELFAHFF